MAAAPAVRRTVRAVEKGSCHMRFKRYISAALLGAVCLLTACGRGDGVWGIYRTAPDDTGNYKSVEFAYSKTFYTDDALAAAAERDSDSENDALLEGWYTVSGDEVRCVYTVKDGDQTDRPEYVFRYDRASDTLTRTDTGEIYTKEEN